ncbi:MAG: 4-hydroxythreonine-4-phosphate dehydrogenase [Ignavibacteriae bacterium]|nr:MAG: 4-hydroxythreonine-4-phosphate dehydrogenase [Ignavibacteriota bacterium]
MKPKIGITMGDFNGIGPEIVLKAVLSPQIKKICVPILIGSTDVFEYYAKLLKLKLTLKEVEYIPETNSEAIPIIPVRKFRIPKILPGKLSFEAGRLAAESVIAAAVLSLNKEIDGMVTAPLAKESIHFDGIPFIGQTEMLAAITKTENYAMLLTHDKMKVALATIHIPIKKVSEELSARVITEKLKVLDISLRKDFAIKAPKIAVLGLNPHSGENGKIGKEEIETIIPAIKQAKNRKINVTGPFPADGFFGSGLYKHFDAILAMYHDQGLIPLKLLGFETGVNFTAGLPIVRTSPDHGTAFEIAGKGIANPSSIISAIKEAVKIIKNRKFVK